MENRDKHLSLLIELLPKYRMLNSLYQKITDDSALYFEEQCRITDFYNEFEDKQVFEKAVLNLLLATDKENQKQIVSNLKAEINKNIDLYAVHKKKIDKVDTLRVCTKRYEPIHAEVDEKQKESDNHASRYTKNQFDNINRLGYAFLSLLNNYYPVEKENILVLEPKSEEPEERVSEETSIIEPDTIFRTKMYEKLLVLEQKLINDKYLNENLQWVSIHENGKTDIKRLVIFLVGSLDNNYFLPNKDPKIKTFFENRYHIKIGQSFEKKRREPLIDKYKTVFYDYHF